MQVTCHPRGDSLGPGSATLCGSARTPRDSTRAFNGASNGDPAGDSSPAATAPPTTKERDSLSHSLTASHQFPPQLPTQLLVTPLLNSAPNPDWFLGVSARPFIAPALRPSFLSARGKNPRSDGVVFLRSNGFFTVAFVFFICREAVVVVEVAWLQCGWRCGGDGVVVVVFVGVLEKVVVR